MPKKKGEQKKDLIDELLDEIYKRRAKGERVGIAFYAPCTISLKSCRDAC